MLSLRELRRAVAALEAARAGARVDKVVEPSLDELVLELSNGAGRPARDRVRVLLSCRPGFGRLCTVDALPPAPATVPPFGQYLKAHLVGGRLAEARLRSDDRQAALVFDTREGRLELLLALMGPRSNLYLLDARGLLLRAARPLAETRRDLAAGEPWRDPESPPPPEGRDRFEDVPDAEILGAIERAYAGAQSEAAEDRLERRLARALERARARAAKKADKLEGDVAAAEEAPRLEAQGELLKANLARVRPGDRELVASDFATGEPVAVPLDPSKPAAANLQELFRRARKARRRAEKAALERGAAQERVEALDALRRELDACIDAAAREAFAVRPDVAHLLERYAPEGAPGEAAADRAPRRAWRVGRRDLPTRLVPKVYRTRDGLEIWVGKNDEGNDVLTTRLARGKDLFFHLEGSPGSHVILRTEGKGDPPQESLLEAAELAVHFSKARSAGRATVHVAEVKDITKPSGAKPGLVYVHRGKTLHLRRQPERLKRVLDARLEE